MTPEVLRWIRIHLPPQGEIIEVGSMDVNGSPRQFAPERWMGVDIQDGPGVDLVADAHKLPFDNETFECAVCAEMLEHDDYPGVTLSELRRVVKHGGRLILTVPVEENGATMSVRAVATK